jgi:hypothetical protein
MTSMYMLASDFTSVQFSVTFSIHVPGNNTNMDLLARDGGDDDDNDVPDVPGGDASDDDDSNDGSAAGDSDDDDRSAALGLSSKAIVDLGRNLVSRGHIV